MADSQNDKADELASTEQPFVAHLIELRDRLIKALIAFAVVFGILMIWPGAGAIYLGQTLNFYKPVRIGDLVLARVTVAAIDEAAARVVLRVSVPGAAVHAVTVLGIYASARRVGVRRSLAAAAALAHLAIDQRE